MAMMASGGGGAPAPKLTNIATGANPRGVSVTAKPVVIPQMLRTGANPRGTAIVVPRTFTPPAAHAVATGPATARGTPYSITHTAAILAPAIAGAAAHGGGILGRLGSEIVHLPTTTLQGVEQLGVPFVRGLVDVFANNIHGAEQQGGQVLKGVKGAVTSDPFYQATVGGNGLKALSANPLGTLLDLTGAYSVVGKGLGAGLRAAGVDAAGLARAPRYIPMMGESSNVATHALENAVGKVSRSYSPNIFTSAVQHAFDAREAGGKFSAATLEHAMHKGVATDHAAESGVEQADRKFVISEGKKYKPSGKAEQNVARFIIPYGTKGTGTVHAAAQAFRDEIANNPEVYGVTAKTRDVLLKQLDEAIAKPNLDTGSVIRATQGYGRVQQALEEKLAQLDAYTQEHMDNATRAQYMQQQPGVHYLPRNAAVADPRLLSDLKAAKAVTRQRLADLQDAISQKRADAQTHARVGAFINRTIPRIPVHYTTDNLMNSFLDAQQMVKDSKPVVTADNKAAIKAARDAVKAAVKDERAAAKAVKQQRMYGTLIEDPRVPAIGGNPKGQVFGMHLRPVEQADYEQSLYHEPAGFHPSHVTAKNLLRDQVQSLKSAASDRTPQLAEVGRQPVSGEAAKVGDINPGWGGVLRSQLDTVSLLRIRRELQNFMARYADPTPYATLEDAQREAEAASAHTGIHLKTITYNGAYRNVPKAALDELSAQFKADHPKGMKLLTKPNQIFRNTVLAMSTKLPIMHSVENISRTALMEGDPLRALVRTPLDIRRHMNVRAAMTDEERARSGAIHTSGSLSHSASGAIGEDVGKLPIEYSGVRAAAQRFSNYAGTVPHTIIRIQRMFELPAQYAAIGAHERQMLQEWGHSWLDANTAVKKYSDELARGIADPAEATRAAQAMHKADGQYTAFTARTRQALRFVPFGSWYMNAARLVMVTLPKDHPLFDALLQDTARHNQAQWNQEHAGLPQDMQASLPVGPNAYLDVGKFTPIGVQSPTLSGVENTASQLFMPWVTSPALAAFESKGPFAEDLYGPNTPYGKSVPAGGSQANLAAAEQIAEEFGGPLNDLARALYGHGGTMYNTDTPVLHLAGIGSVAEKPGSTTQQTGPLSGLLGRTLDKVLDPFHPTTFHTSGSSGDAHLGTYVGGKGNAFAGGRGGTYAGGR